MSAEKRSTSPTSASTDSKKPRMQSTSSRGVANLTPDQLAKKRANDREAQRAIRERTKNQIESLEKRIKEYQEQEPHKELQNALRDKERVEEEYRDVKRRLEAVWALLEPVLAPIVPATVAGELSPPPPPLPEIEASSPGIKGTWNISEESDTRNTKHTQTHARTVPQELVGSRQKQETSTRLGLDFLLDNLPRSPASPHKTSARGIRLDYQATTMTSSSLNYNNDRSSDNFVPGHAAPCLNGPPTCPLDKIILDFLAERRSLQHSGASLSTLIGPAYPSLSSLLSSNTSSVSLHPVSQVVSDILAKFHELSSLPEKVAILYIIFLVIRWAINPTPANYDRLPSWMCPRACQLFEYHPIWIDFLPFPHMRDHLVRNCQRDYPFDVFFNPYTKALNLNWAYDPKDCLIRIDGELTLNPVFETHLRDLRNWTLRPAFDKAFPALVGLYRSNKEKDWP